MFKHPVSYEVVLSAQPGPVGAGLQGDFLYIEHFAHTFLHKKCGSIFENYSLNWPGGLRDQFKISNVNFRRTFENFQLRRFFKYFSNLREIFFCEIFFSLSRRFN